MLARFVPVRSSGCRFVQVRKAGVKRFAVRAFRRALNQSLQSIVSTGKQKKKKGPRTDDSRKDASNRASASARALSFRHPRHTCKATHSTPCRVTQGELCDGSATHRTQHGPVPDTINSILRVHPRLSLAFFQPGADHLCVPIDV